MTHQQSGRVSLVWAALGVTLSVSLNLFAAWIIAVEVQKPDAPVIEACPTTPKIGGN